MDAVAAYHREHGDDYGSEESRVLKYEAILSLIDFSDFDNPSILDVGCGKRRFIEWLPAAAQYTGIDLLDGQDVRDYTTKHAVVVANGVLYKLATTAEAMELIRHMWMLAKDALIFTSLSTWGGYRPGELALSPLATIQFCAGLSERIAFRHDYLPHDFTIALYR